MAEKLYYSMGEVTEMFDVNPSLIRYWGTQFDAIAPKRNKKGNRMFSPEDIETLKLIYHLVKERGMTIEGARKALKAKRKDASTPREVELLERLQRLRAMLVQVREELGAGADTRIIDSDIAPEEELRPTEKATTESAETKSVPTAPDAEPAEPEKVAEPEPKPKTKRGRKAKEPVPAPVETEQAEMFAGEQPEPQSEQQSDPQPEQQPEPQSEQQPELFQEESAESTPAPENEERPLPFYEQTLF